MTVITIQMNMIRKHWIPIGWLLSETDQVNSQLTWICVEFLVVIDRLEKARYLIFTSPGVRIVWK